MSQYERRMLGTRRAWQIASEKSLDEMYRCVFDWVEPDTTDRQQPDTDDMEDTPPPRES